MTSRDLPKHVFLPRVELLDREEIEALQTRKLRRQVERLYATNRFYRERWDRAGVTPDDIRTREDVRRLPFTTKQDYLADQEAHAPFGLRLGVPETEVFEVTLTSGTSGKGQEIHGQTVLDAHLRGQMTAIGWAWGGLSRTDSAVFHIPASNSASLYTMLRGIRAVGRLPYLVAHMGFEERLRFMETFGVNAMYAMPSALNGMAQLCDDLGMDPRTAFPDLKFIMTSAESWPVEWVGRMEQTWGARIIEEYGSTQTNAAYGASCCEYGAVVDGERGNNHLFEWTILYEVLDPATGEHVAEGEPGELIITHLDKEASPIMRFRTGDRVTYYRWNRCPCGRQYDAAEAGTIGRVDQMLKVKGQNIWPPDIDALLFAHPEIDEFQARAYIGEKGRDEMELRFSLKAGVDVSGEEFADALTRELKDSTNITFRVHHVAPDELPHFLSPDEKARRWTDDRHTGLATGDAG
ncbi:MAG: AMP-binding protein [Actinobacteria bacterium]|nr:AMP-binding protein [Actinomycetota bacterium]